MLAVTTFPEWAWDVYAKRCIESWLKVWPGSILVYYEGSAPPTRKTGIESRPLDCSYRDQFLSLNVPKPPNYLYDVKRFCHKVFAQLLALKDHDQFFWLDADIEMISEPPKELLQDMIEKSFVTFLGRNTYTETGVIGFNKLDPGFSYFENRYRDCYIGNQIFHLPYWTDCHAFDYARDGKGHDLTPHGYGVENVLERSVLGNYMVHHKGNLKFKLEEQGEQISANL